MIQEMWSNNHFNLDQTLLFVPERSSCSSESFSRLTLSSKALLTYSCCSIGVCFTALGLAQAWDTVRNTWKHTHTYIHVKIINVYELTYDSTSQCSHLDEQWPSLPVCCEVTQNVSQDSCLGKKTCASDDIYKMTHMVYWQAACSYLILVL